MSTEKYFIRNASLMGQNVLRISGYTVEEEKNQYWSMRKLIC